jgi:two-component system sensor histidine kinase MtrB
VVRPVRQAAATAERLAAGRLKDRMSVRGEDDLATLAASFNRMADTVQRQILQLRELSRVQRRFVADVSHELRTPITTIRMAADLLHDAMADLPPELARSTELLQLQLDRFELLLADLLEISRHDAGAAVLEAEPTDLGHLVGKVVATATHLAVTRGTDLRADVPVTPVIVDVDGRRIDRVLRNLVENAIEHAEGGPVEVRLVPGATAVAITVRDYGIGLKPGESSLVFGRFWRADPARTRTTGGTGLGLSIALEDTRLHGGWLQAWGEPGRGSVFRLTLPWRTGGVIVESPLPLSPDDEATPVPPGVRHG